MRWRAQVQIGFPWGPREVLDVRQGSNRVGRSTCERDRDEVDKRHAEQQKPQKAN